MWIVQNPNPLRTRASKIYIPFQESCTELMYKSPAIVFLPRYQKSKVCQPDTLWDMRILCMNQQTSHALAGVFFKSHFMIICKMVHATDVTKILYLGPNYEPKNLLESIIFFLLFFFFFVENLVLIIIFTKYVHFIFLLNKYKYNYSINKLVGHWFYSLY